MNLSTTGLDRGLLRTYEEYLADPRDLPPGLSRKKWRRRVLNELAWIGSLERDYSQGTVVYVTGPLRGVS